MRRSRIIISDNIENSNDNNKREIYDSETKYKKSIISAVAFNEFLNNSRADAAKHFLKRKVKAAYEREPIDKNKAFFNVSFLPTMAMFMPPAQQSQGINISSGMPSSNPGINLSRNTQSSNTNLNPVLNKPMNTHIPNAHSTVQNSNLINPNQNKQEIIKAPLLEEAQSQTSNIPSLNKTTESNISLNKSQSQNTISTSNKSENKLFNVNQNVQNFSFLNKNIPQPEEHPMEERKIVFPIEKQPEKDIKIEFNSSRDKEKDNFNVNIQQSHNLNLNSKPNQPQISSTPHAFNPDLSKLTNEQIEQLKLRKALAQKMGTNPPTQQNLSSNLNEILRQQQIIKQNLILKQLIEAYKNDPEKLKYEMPPLEFQKVIININI